MDDFLTKRFWTVGTAWTSGIDVLPNVLAMGIILLGGIFIAWALGSFAERLFRVIGFDHFCDRVGMNAALLRGGVKTDPSRLIGRASIGR